MRASIRGNLRRALCCLGAWLITAALACGGVSPEPRPATPSPPRAPDAPPATSASEPSSTPVSSAASASGSAVAEASSAAPFAERPRFACAPPDRGFADHAPFVTRGKLKISVPLTRPRSGAYDVVFHFHFSDAARRTIVFAAPEVVIAGLDLGEGSRVYGAALSDPRAFTGMLADVEATLRESTGDPEAQVGRVALSSWSAGFAATTRILKHHAARVDAVFFLDSLYAPYEKDADGELRVGAVYAPALSSVLAFARRAALGEATLFVSTSDAPTTGYASTKEVAAWLLGRLGARLPDGGRLDAPARLDRGEVHVRVHGGNSAAAHCLHLGLAGEAVALWQARARGTDAPRSERVRR